VYQKTDKGKKLQSQRSKKYFSNSKPAFKERLRQYRLTFKGYLFHKYYAIKQRCDNPNCKAYKNYGGRGIENRFKSSEEFMVYIITELGITSLKQIKGLDLDRIDNEGHYEKGNLRFTTHKENMNNRRKQNV